MPTVTMLDKALAAIEQTVWSELAKAYQLKFGHQVKTEWDLMVGHYGASVTKRCDGRPMTAEQKLFTEAWVEGWQACVATLRHNQHQARKAR